jgi:hypothetical protein
MTDTSQTPYPYTADDAFARLLEGNERFVRGVVLFPTAQKEILATAHKLVRVIFAMLSNKTFFRKGVAVE